MTGAGIAEHRFYGSTEGNQTQLGTGQAGGDPEE